MKYVFLLLISFISMQSVVAQKPIKVKGLVKTSEGKNLSGASVVLYYPGKKDSLRAVTNDKGSFTIPNVVPGKVSVLVSFIGYRSFFNEYDYSKSTEDENIWDITMTPGDNLLEDVTVQAAKIQIKEDTISYIIDSTMYRKNDNVEEVLKKLPGVEVDKTGKVTAQGKEVTRVKVNGKDFFGGDVTTATREINADMVDKIQIVDDYGDQSAFTGVRDGEATKTLNIQLKKDKNKGYFGNVTAGVGTEERYLAGVSLNLFNNDRQVSIIGNINNTNASNFNFGNVGGGMGTAMAAFGGRGGGGGFGNTGINDGINVTKSLGVNFRDQWGSKVSAYGSYSFSDRRSTIIQSQTQENFLEDGIITNVQNANNYNTNINHRFQFNIEYKIDSFNYIKFTPQVNFRQNDKDNVSDFSFTNASGVKTNDGITSSVSDSKTPNISGTLLFNHRFKKRGRTFSLNLNAGNSNTSSDEDFVNLNTVYAVPPFTDSLYQNILQDNTSDNLSIRASYIEPLSKKKSLEFNYAYSEQLSGNDRQNFLVNPYTGELTFQESLSNIFDNTYITNRFGFNYRMNEKKYNYSVGFAVQPASIETNSVTGKFSSKQNIVNYFPVVRYSYNFSRSRSFSINYNGSTNQPSFTQLQPVTDSSNPQFVTVGNPELRPEFTNTLNLRYNNFDFISGNVFFGNIFGSFTDDKIVNNVFQTGPGTQETRYLNANGYFTLGAFYAISRPYQNRKYVFTLGGNLAYNNNVSYIADQKNIGKNLVVGQRLAFDYRLKQWLESNLTFNFNINNNEYSLNKQLNSTTKTYTISHNSRIFFPKSFILSYDLEKVINEGFAGNVNTNPFIINATLEKQFSKKKNLSLKLQAFDMLNENIGISRTVQNNTVTDTRTNRLGRYFMLSAVIRLNKFVGQAPQQSGMMMGGPGAPTIIRN
jgi:hypothetical protein